MSDNPSAQPNDTPIQTDGFETAQGRFQLNHIGRLTQDQAAYTIMSTTWFRGTQGSSRTHTLRLSTEIQAGADTSVTFNGGATLSQLSMLDTATSADPQTVGPRPAGNQEFVTFQAGEALAWQIDGSWHLNQSLQGSMFRPINNNTDATTNRNLTLDVQLTREWQQDWAGVQSRLGAMSTSSIEQAGQPLTPGSNSEFAELTLSWRHYWTPDLRHELAAGAFVLRADQTRVLPAASASANWRSFGREIELRAGQAADSNIYIGEIYQRRFVSLRVALAVDSLETFRLVANASLERVSTTGDSAGGQRAANIIATRFGMHWQPGDTFAFGLEYSFRNQRADATGTDSSPYLTFRRQMALFTIEAHYPSGL